MPSVRAVSLASLVATALASKQTPEDRIRAAFSDPGFLWGSATAAYQVEGAWNEDGRQASIWDDFCHLPSKPCSGDTGDVADDFYHKYKGDISMLKDLGFNSLRMSISWPRIFPLGTDGNHAPNPKGVQFYKNVLAALKAAGIVPMVTIFHWDLPNDLDWLSDTVVDEYMKYVEFLFKTFPEIKHWATFNEPLSFCPNGYNSGAWPPAIKSDYLHLMCGHNVLRSHARATKLYREHFQKDQGGKIGIVIDYKWAYPMNVNSTEDKLAQQLHHDFHMGWWADPIFLNGDYPTSMRSFYGDNLPRFTDEEMKALKHSADFYGVNTYGAKYVQFDPEGVNGQFKEINPCQDFDHPPAGACAQSPWLWIHPPAMRLYLEYVHNRYNLSDVYITEFGMDVKGETEMELDQALDDQQREAYYRNYLDEAATAKRDGGVPVKGAFAWSLLDNLEWKDGYTSRFGITYVNFTTQQRYPKRSAKWFQKLLVPASETLV